MKLVTFNVETNQPCAFDLPFLKKDAKTKTVDGTIDVEQLEKFFDDVVRGIGTIYETREQRGQKRIARAKQNRLERQFSEAQKAEEAATKELDDPKKTERDTGRLRSEVNRARKEMRRLQSQLDKVQSEIEGLALVPDPNCPVELEWETYEVDEGSKENQPKYKGWVVTPVSGKDGVNIHQSQKPTICSALMEALDLAMGAYGFAIQHDNGSPVRGVAGDAKGEIDVLQSVCLVNASDLMDVGFNKKDNQRNNNSNILVDVGLRVDKGDGTDQVGYPYDFFALLDGSRLWVPKRIPLLFTDPTETDFWWAVDNNNLSLSRQELPGAGALGCYALKGGTLSAWPLVGQPEKGGAGGGAMRSDRVDEAAYWWSGSKQLGYALDFDTARYLGGINTAAPGGFSECATPRAPVSAAAKLPDGGRSAKTVPGQDMNCEIRYYKSFANTSGAKKKNKPKETVPLTFAIKGKDLFAGGGLKKKKKGSWIMIDGGVATKGEVLKHTNVDRAPAGKVMSEEFKLRGFGPAGVNLRSATAFACYVVSANGDATACEAWTDASADLKKLVGGAADAKAKAAIRTDQEWCHLYGHGDGGTEEIGNFHSGSKHCNTEQLAIECGQRTGKLPSLTVKVTAYLLPNKGFDWKPNGQEADKRAQWLKDNFKGIEFANLVAVLNHWPPDLTNYLVEKPKDPSIPSRETWSVALKTPKKAAALSAAVRDRLLELVTVRYPLGYQVRYKIFNARKKVFDHVFSAQKEAFDYNEFKLLEHTVKRVIAQSNDTAEAFAETINGRIKRRFDASSDQKADGKFLGIPPGQGANCDLYEVP